MRSQGFDPFLPVRKVRRKWSDRIKTIEEPLFPNYLFCRFEETERVKILRCAGVAQIVGAGRTPLPVSDDEIRSIQALVDSNLVLSPHPFIQIGKRVRLTSGPLTGVEGTVVRHEDGRSRLVVSVTILQRAVATEIDYDWVAPAESEPALARPE